jgi:hypothetical protein
MSVVLVSLATDPESLSSDGGYVCDADSVAIFELIIMFGFRMKVATVLTLIGFYLAV